MITRKIVLALVVLIGIGGVAFLLLRTRPAPPPPAPPVAAPPVAAPVAVAPPADCLLPGPPPVAPNGATASEADMRLGQHVIQAFVVQLEHYQACRNDQLDHAPASVSAARKQIWLDEGNAAVDEANALADAFSAQLKIFKARPKK